MPSNWVSSHNSAFQIEGGETSVLNSRIVNDLRYAYSYLHSHADPVTSQNCSDPIVCIGVGGPEIIPFDDPAFHIGNRPAAPLAIFPATNQLLERSHRASPHSGRHSATAITQLHNGDWKR